MGCGTSRALPVATGPPGGAGLDAALISPQDLGAVSLGAGPLRTPDGSGGALPDMDSSSASLLASGTGSGKEDSPSGRQRGPSWSGFKAAKAVGDAHVAVSLRSKRRGVRVAGTDVHVDENYVRRVVAKEQGVRDMIAAALQSNVLFAALGAEALADIVDAMEPRDVEIGTTIITQGEPGDWFYVIETGGFEIIVGGKKVADWGEGTKNRAVGELALMYNSPRAATVRAVSDSRLWQIDRATFRSVIAQSAYHAHAQMKATLRKGILEDLEDSQLDKIADSANRVSFAKGDQIIRKGEEGEVFYVIESGSILCKNLPGEQSNNVLHAGDYFGERALLKREPRACDVFAETDVTLIAVAREDFESLLGHLRELLEHNLGMRLLLCVPILAQLREDDRNMLFSQLRLLTFRDGQVLLAQGTAVSQFFIVREGTVTVSHNLAPVFPGSSSPLAAAAASLAEAPFAPSSSSSSLSASEAKMSSSSSTSEPTSSSIDLRVSSKLSVNAGKPVRPLSAAAARTSVESDGVGFLTAGQWFGEAEIEGTLASEVTYVAHGPVECFVLDARTYSVVLAPYIRGARAPNNVAPGGAATAGGSAAGDATAGAAKSPAAGAEKRPDEALLVLRSPPGHETAPAAATTVLVPEPSGRSESAVRALHRSQVAAQGPRQRLGLAFRDLEQRQTLGTGTFGRVRIVLHRQTNRVYALKMLKKAQIVALKQQQNIMNEKEILWRVDHPFIIRLFDTYQDRDRLYMLMELVQGGELFARLQNSSTPGRVSPSDARFYAGCVLDALEHLHSLDIVYRDLKPENLLIDAEGYMKIVDFGFAKVVTNRTYTLCGTPEYLAPELVLGKGHDRGVDYWALGILLYEQVSGYSPFADQPNNDQMVICRNILKGEVNFPAHVKDKDLKDIILKLLIKDVPRRFGCLRNGAQDIKHHRFFRSLDFDELFARRVPAPWKPQLKGQLDTAHFDEYDEEDEVEDYDDTSGWERSF